MIWKDIKPGDCFRTEESEDYVMDINGVIRRIDSINNPKYDRATHERRHKEYQEALNKCLEELHVKFPDFTEFRLDVPFHYYNIDSRVYVNVETELKKEDFKDIEITLLYSSF
jgi:hypothetical protein